jgi:hypothetical protein
MPAGFKPKGEIWVSYFTHTILSNRVVVCVCVCVCACVRACVRACVGGEKEIAQAMYSKCHVTSNKANSNLECAEDKFQTRGWVQGCEK